MNLREHVRSGTISAAEFSVMSAAEMKSQEREDQDRKMRGTILDLEHTKKDFMIN